MKKITTQKKQEVSFSFPTVLKIDFDKLTIKNCELFEILNKLYLYRKKPKKAYLVTVYNIAIAAIDLIAAEEL